MESRYRTILPIVGIVLIVIIALVAFFITRKVSNSTLTAEASPTVTPMASNASQNLLFTQTSVPSASGAKTALRTNTSTGLSSIRTQPVTGVISTPLATYTTSITNSGFTDPRISIQKGVSVPWINNATTPQTMAIDGLSAGTFGVGQQFSYLFDLSKQYTITLSGTSTSQTITVQ